MGKDGRKMNAYCVYFEPGVMVRWFSMACFNPISESESESEVAQSCPILCDPTVGSGL